MKYNPFQACGKYKVSGELGPEVVPPRFVYHLDYTGGRSSTSEYVDYIRMNIAKEGLFGRDMGNGGVWANVYQSNAFNWFPVCLDVWDLLGRESWEYVYLVEKYDVWRIDTHRIKNKWYIDPNMLEGEVKDLSKVLYTPDTVPGRALQLFHMQWDKDLWYDHDIAKLAPLIPFRKINEFIRFTHRRKRKYLEIRG